MANREIIPWGEAGDRMGKGPVTKYMDAILMTKKQDWVLLNAKIIKLSQYGMEIVEGNIYKPLKHIQDKIDGRLIRIRHGRHRIYTLLTPTHLFLLEGEDKQSNETPLVLLRTMVARAQSIT